MPRGPLSPGAGPLVCDQGHPGDGVGNDPNAGPHRRNLHARPGRHGFSRSCRAAAEQVRELGCGDRLGGVLDVPRLLESA